MRRGLEALCIAIITGYSYASNSKVAPVWRGHRYRSGSGTSVRPVAVADRARRGVFHVLQLEVPHRLAAQQLEVYEMTDTIRL